MAAEQAQEAINRLAQERERLIAWVRSVPSEDWSKLSPDGMWQARDYVAHPASIDPLLTGLTRAFQSDGGVGGAKGRMRAALWQAKVSSPSAMKRSAGCCRTTPR